jgi:uncharacterized protein YbbK (DUF523 family)
MIQVGVSRCLLGDAVRYDGGHRRDEAVCSVLARLFKLVPVCLEVDSGMGVPRPPVRLVEWENGMIRVLGAEDENLDVTEALVRHSRVLVSRLEGVSGFILKSRSPSCGLARVPVFPWAGGVARVDGTGVFARALREAFPSLPMIEEGQLADSAGREDFIERVRTYHRQRIYGLHPALRATPSQREVSS